MYKRLCSRAHFAPPPSCISLAKGAGIHDRSLRADLQKLPLTPPPPHLYLYEAAALILPSKSAGTFHRDLQLDTELNNSGAAEPPLTSLKFLRPIHQRGDF